MNKEEQKKFEENVGQAINSVMSDPKYWARKKYRWDEWGSPVGLSLGWTLFIVPLGVFLYLPYLAGLIG